MAASGAGLAALAAFEWATRKHPLVPLLVGAIILGAMISLFGLRTILRKRPMLAADERGLFVSATGSDASLLPWEIVSGAEVVGKPTGPELAILTRDVDEALKHVCTALVGSVRSSNRKYQRSAAFYLLGRWMGEPPLAVALRIRAILAQIEDPSAQDGRDVSSE